MVPADCIADKNWSFYDSLLIETIFPFVILGVILMVLGIRRCRGHDPDAAKKSLKKQIGIFVRFILLILPAISRRVCQTFQCLHYDDGDVKLLVADLSVNCETNKMLSFQAYAGVMMMIYPFGKSDCLIFGFGIHKCYPPFLFSQECQFPCTCGSDNSDRSSMMRRRERPT